MSRTNSTFRSGLLGRARSGLPAVSLDLPEVYGGCTPALSWATAALLSARFPTLTPAGRFPGGASSRGGAQPDCEDPSPGPLQLVDGGYAERTGLGTLSDLAPELMGAVRRWNAAAVA